ncbi:DUF3606 domain-containing protein [Flaviaesturariibacter aridisoli]|uniref:DUF3606 domain-containing protein n=1 Tax=Flaviaesturariibacter aridisoli TaxID=2545761 RepID=A0A4R4DSR2_9BACT|nr:DUF3606 domain-containing protein [Flaviaesturariibacter aridisoli]TCZ65759.1 DUF3606 domain-containing protein [Flaviaesturariibacter aridisoli]
MSDNKNDRGARDRARVSGEEKYEVDYIAGKFNVSAEEVRRIIKEVGNSREKIEERLRGGRR